MSNWSNQLRDYFRLEQDENADVEPLAEDGEQSLGERIDGSILGMCELSRMERIYGFVTCFAVGFLLSAVSIISLSFGNIKGFATLYSFGNIVSLMSSCFFSGPVAQTKRMFDQSRMVASLVMILSIILCLISAVVLDSLLLTIVFLCVEMAAMLWYMLSYIPGGRTALRALVVRVDV
eukprot:Clim_evm134s147 gene=Clim_evmTU134s147